MMTAKLGLLLLTTALSAHSAETVWLSTLDLSPMQQGWGKPQVNRSIREKPLSIAGKTFQRGIGTHASSTFWLDLGGGTEKFLAFVGVDDAAGSPKASVNFRIFGDGKKLWESGLMKPQEPAKAVDLDLRGVKTLLLQVGDAGDGIEYDHANWADARFIVAGAAPKPMRAPREEAVVLTPKPPRKPRINGPKVFGVRPNSPFLYRMPVTGDRPLTYSVRNLPEGLVIDSQTGIITGRLHARGEYRVTFRAENAQGVAERPFQIVCGDTLALTPHMGWNSWYIWENHITDAIMRAAADAMVSSGMANYGYQYVNIDDCWAIKPDSKDPALQGQKRDHNNRINSNHRFPNMSALTAHIHDLGLKAGIYTSPGPLTCAGHVGSYQYEEQDVARFVEWGFDFLKHDWCSYGQIAKGNSREDFKKPYVLMGNILRKQPRDIVLNLCQYGMGNVWEWGAEVGGHSWRTAGDLGASFEGIAAGLFRDGFDVYARNELHKYGGPGHWNDPDYLLFGYLSNWKGQTALTPLTPNEQYTQMSLWCLVAAPLIFSGDMNRLDEFTLNVLCNHEVIDVDQDTLGKPGRRIAKIDDLEVWAKEMEDGSKAIGLFNRGEMETPVTARWSELGLSGKQKVRDLWRQQDLGVFESEFQAPVPRHGVVLVRMFPVP